MEESNEEEIKDELNKESNGTKIKLIYYLNKNPKKEDNMKLCLLENNHNFIFYEQITISFCDYLNELNYNSTNEENNDSEIFPHLEVKNINFDYIRYFNGKSWILLDKGIIIALNKNLTFDTLKIMIKATILIKEKKKIQNNYRFFNQRIERINTYLDNIESNNIPKKNPIYMSVLTANPLMDGEKELRTMNDFNIIPGSIYKVLKETDYLKYSTFDVLNKKTLKEGISNKPHILHLIFKSTYIIPAEKENIKSDDSSDYVNLIFEQENDYNLEFINKDKLKEYLSDIKEEDKKNIILIISTPLSDDVKKIFEEIGFKNIIVQHTTLANISLIANFNSLLYEDLILSGLQIIKENNIYFLLKYLSEQTEYTICCCFHKHKVGQCTFVKNLINELYNINEKISEKDKIKEIIPHFSHLVPKCTFTNSCMEDDFYTHMYGCIERFDLDYKPKEKEEEKNNKKKKRKIIKFTCCCYDEEKKDDYKKHNIDTSFNCVFNDNNNSNNNSNNNNSNNNKYENIELIVGRNKDMARILDFLNTDKDNFNIYGDKINNLKKFGNVIIEYYKERYSDKADFIRFYFTSYDDIDKFNYESNNKIYFFYLEDKNLFDKIKKKGNINNKRIIWFSEEAIEDNSMKDKIEINKEPELKEESEYKYKIKFPPNDYIKYQEKRFSRDIWLNSEKKF